MPGATATNIRKADIAEDMGKLLLRQFCAIAPISKSDDFGIDCIATLLKLDPDNSLRELADKTFGIQFKSKSVTEIKFTQEHEYNWLLNLDYPYFIGSVDISNSTMEIYTLHMINCIPGINEGCKGLIISLDENKENTENNVMTLPVGDPIITFGLKDFQNKEKINKILEILTAWVSTEYENIRIRNIGFTKFYKWETNKMPVFNTVNKSFTNTENRKVYEEAFDFLDSALVELLVFNNDKYLKKGILKINEVLKSKGIDLFQLNNMDIDDFKEKINRT
jgi:hypothetical protein